MKFNFVHIYENIFNKKFFEMSEQCVFIKNILSLKIQEIALIDLEYIFSNAFPIF